MKTKYLSWILLVVLLSVLGLTACKLSATPTAEPIQVDENGYPVQSQDAAEAYPTIDNHYNDVSELKPPADAHAPEAGKASISGLIYVPTTQSVVKSTVIYLVPAEGDNKDQVPGILIGSGMTTRGDILSRTDENGIFYIDNIPPGNYFLVVSFLNNIILTSVSETDLSPRLLKFESDASLPLGLIVSPGD
jgi:hypothetical protein